MAHPYLQEPLVARLSGLFNTCYILPTLQQDTLTVLKGDVFKITAGGLNLEAGQK